MPMEKDELAELEKLLKKARQKPLPFGVCMGKSPENTVLYLHLKKPPEVLMRNAKKAGETSKVSYGTCNVNGKIVSLTCEGDILPGMARNMKRFLLKNEIKMKVEILDPEGNLLESDGDEDEDGEAPTEATGDDLDPAAEAWSQLSAALSPAVKTFVESGNEKGPAVQKAWDGAHKAAEGGDYKSATAVANKIRPLLGVPDEAGSADSTDTPADDPNAAAWAKIAGPLEQLYLKAMGNNPPNRTQLEGAYMMAVDKANEAQDYKAALTIAKKLKPALEEAAKGGSGTEVPKDVVAFQKSRVLWVDTRNKMKTEMKKLEAAIAQVCKDDPDLAPVVAEVNELSKRLEVFDGRLEDVLDRITNTPEGDQRTQLKKEAIAAIKDYQTALGEPFFSEVDSDNGFVNVQVASSATKSLNSIAKVLQAA